MKLTTDIIFGGETLKRFLLNSWIRHLYLLSGLLYDTMPTVHASAIKTVGPGIEGTGRDEGEGQKKGKDAQREG